MTKGKGKQAAVEELRARRTAQLAQISPVLDVSTKRLAELRKDQRQCDMLKSVAGGLYEELDKLSKKAPAEPVTKLVLGEVNDLTAQVKALGRDDPFLQRLKEFVPAGEMPEQRDAVVVLTLARRGLERVSESLSSSITREGTRNREARLVKLALEYFLEHGELLTKSDLDDLGETAPQGWLIYPHYEFDFRRLDRLNIEAYFAGELNESDDELEDE